MGRLIIQLTLTLLAFGWQGHVWADSDHDRAFSLQNSGEILPLENLLKQISGEITGNILEVELERERGMLIYELHILDDKGVVWEIKVNAKNGDIIEKEQE